MKKLIVVLYLLAYTITSMAQEANRDQGNCSVNPVIVV